MRSLLFGSAVALFVSACSPGSFNGTVAGNSLSVADAIFAQVKDDNGKIFGAYIVLADQPNLCDTLKANREPKQSTYVSFTLLKASDTEFLAPDIGEYTIVTGLPSANASSAYAQFDHSDANCTNTLSEDARTGKSGLIKLQSYKAESGGSASGTFDVTFGAGDGVKGAFNASYCDLSKLPSDLNCE